MVFDLLNQYCMKVLIFLYYYFIKQLFHESITYYCRAWGVQLIKAHIVLNKILCFHNPGSGCGEINGCGLTLPSERI